MNKSYKYTRITVIMNNVMAVIALVTMAIIVALVVYLNSEMDTLVTGLGTDISSDGASNIVELAFFRAALFAAALLALSILSIVSTCLGYVWVSSNANGLKDKMLDNVKVRAILTVICLAIFCGLSLSVDNPGIIVPAVVGYEIALLILQLLSYLSLRKEEVIKVEVEDAPTT